MFKINNTSLIQLKQRSRERKRGEEKKGESLTEEEKSEKREIVLEKPIPDVSISETETLNGKIADSENQSDAALVQNDPVMFEEEQVVWPRLPGSFFQNLDSPFLGKDDKNFNSMKPEFALHLRKNGSMSTVLESADEKPQRLLEKSKRKPTSKAHTNLGGNRNNISGGVERKWREGEEGREDLRRRRKLAARLRKLREESDAREEGGRVVRDGEEEEKAILSLEAKEGGVSLYKRIMDYTSKDFSARTDPTTAIVNAASRHLD